MFVLQISCTEEKKSEYIKSAFNVCGPVNPLSHDVLYMYDSLTGHQESSKSESRRPHPLESPRCHCGPFRYIIHSPTCASETHVHSILVKYREDNPDIHKCMHSINQETPDAQP